MSADSYFPAATVDDAMRDLLEAIGKHGRNEVATRGPFREISGVLVTITNPRCRISLTESRGRILSALGELCWYLAGDNSLDFIRYYIRRYEDDAEGDIVFGGYGPRMFGGARSQVEVVLTMLRNSPSTRRAVIQLFDRTDVATRHKEVPCTCTFQFLVRNDCLEMITSMRSNDVYIGFPHDIFCFTMLQEIIARDLGIEIGIYKHMVGSLHLYDDDGAKTSDFINEGWQSTVTPMPSMPLGDPWPALRVLVAAERAIRVEGVDAAVVPPDLDPYWRDLITLLQVFRARKDGRAERVSALTRSLTHDIYRTYLG